LATFDGGHCCWNTFYDPAWKWTSNNPTDIGAYNDMSIYDWMLQYRLTPPGTPAHDPPVANAGSNQTITLPVDSLLLDGSASSDSDGTITSYLWAQQSGPSAYNIVNPDSVWTEVTGLDTGTYIFILTVTDNSGATDSSIVSITVAVHTGGVPDKNGFYADAGPDITTTMPFNIVTLDASRTKQEEPNINIGNYHWDKISGPQQYSLPFPDKEITNVGGLTAGTYTFKLTITITAGEKITDTMQVFVLPDPTMPGDVNYNADTIVPSYNQLFQYGSNPGYYGNGWSDTGKASVLAANGVHTIRPNLPGYFVEQWGYDIRVNEFNYYTHQAGMKEITLFIGQPADDESAPGTGVFANLYSPIWDNGQNGTPVNDSNYFAVYVYNLVKRYGKNVKFWEIVNEPDQTGFWDNGNRSRSDNWWINPPLASALLNLKAPIFSYIRMLRIAYEVIKKFYPNEYICPGGIGYPAFLDALLRYTDNPDSGKVTPEYPLTGGAYFDVLSYHIYP
ncbi:MAG: PKD domain-containing protein, partial [Chitinophagaceae bacterium]